MLLGVTQLQSTISQQMNKPSFQLKPLGACSPPPNHPKETSLHHPKEHRTNNYTTASPTHRLNKPSSFHNLVTSHTGAHLMQPRSEACEIEDLCFRVSVARRLTAAPAPGCCQPCRCGTVFPQQKCCRCHLQQTS